MVELNKFIAGTKARRIFISLILIYISFLFYRVYDYSDFKNTEERKLYQTYLTYLDGPLTQEKEDYLNNENLSISEAKNIMSSSADNLFSNNLSSDEFESLFNENETILKKELAFKEVWDRYSYVYEDRRNRFFLKGNGEYILEENINILLYMGIIFVVVPFLHIEKENGMIDLIRTSINGNKKVAKNKIRIIFIFTFIFVLIFQIVDLLLFIYQNGSQALFYPMQSLKIFSTSSYSFNILYVFFTITLLRIIGYIGFTALIIIITECSNFKALPYYVPITILILTQGAVKVKSKIYACPTPLSLMRATGFFMGNINEERLGSSYVFNEIQIEFLIASLFITLMTIILSIFIIIRSYKNYRLTENVKKLGFVFFAILILLTGCIKQNDESDELYNFHNQFFTAQNDDYIFYKTGNEIYMKNKKSLVITPVTKNPFLENMSYDIGPMFVNNDSFFYSLIYEEGDDISASSTNEIIKVSLESLVENIIWKRKITQETYFMDLIYLERNNFFDSIFNIFAINQKLYAVGEESVGIPNLFNREKIVIEKLDGYIKGIKGNKCFYLSVDKKIKSYDLKKKEVRIWNDKQFEEYILTIHGILYSSYDGIGFVDFNGEDLGVISGIKAKSLGYDGENIYFIKRNTSDLYRMNQIGENIEKINENIFYFEVSNNSDDLVVYSYNDFGDIEIKIISK